MTRGAVAAGHWLTAEAGAGVLRDGGNAVDAAIAAVAMACVCEPVLCSPGGGAFAMVRDGADGSVRLIDAFPHTPRRHDAALDDGVHEIHADFGTATQEFHVGPATSATPGLMAGLATLADRFGSIPLVDLVVAAAAAARDGIEVTPFQHHLSTVVAPILTANPAARALFAPDGELVRTGDTFHNPQLADGLEILAAEGLAHSPVGDAVVALQAGRGHLTRDDLVGYQVIERVPIVTTVAGATVHLNPLPAAGGVLVRHTLAQLDRTDSLALARAIDATGRERRRVDGDVAELADLPVRPRGTTHVSVIEESGSACAITVSNGEGNGEVVDGFGFMLNNILGEDDVNPAGPRGWPPDTRLSSMMCPTIVEHPDGAITALGSGGSNRIRSAISQVVARLCVDGSSLRSAVDAPRVHVEGDHLDVEHTPDESETATLLAAYEDHLVWPRPDLFFGGVHAVRRRADGTIVGAGDRRRAGAVVTVG